MIKKQIINHLINNGGKLTTEETWLSLAERYGIEAPDKKRAAKDQGYKNKAIGRIAQQIWQTYTKQEQKLSLVKQTFKDNKLMFETFREKTEQAVPIDYTDFEIEKLTTNPNGVPWIKMRKKEHFHSEEHLETLKELLVKEVSPIEYTPSLASNGKAHFVYGSDKHIGALTKLDSIYKNKYDREVMRERIVIATIENIEESVALHGSFEALYIMDFGDALDGFNAKTTGGLRGTSSHTLPQQLNNREQHDFYVELHKELFDIIMTKSYAKEVYFVATSNSNHGGDFEYGAMRHLQTYLEVRYPDIKTYVSYKAYNHFIYGGHAIIFGHGKDDEDMKNGLPLVINDKVATVLSDYIRVNKLEEYNVSVISGDLHQSADGYAKNFRYKKVLAQYGSSKWMHTNFGSGQPGLSSEVFVNGSRTIYKQEDFFDIENESNTGIDF
tara:strand:+ start:1165 stop:2484 length:1320 start_codon:yes stop_codon:yes gene_type:complete